VLHFDNEIVENNTEQVIETIRLAVCKKGRFDFRLVALNNDTRREA